MVLVLHCERETASGFGLAIAPESADNNEHYPPAAS
jgi:hypothetical protein